MKTILWQVCKRLGIIARCPNCESAWTGGINDPYNETHCLVCGDKNGRITGWVWGTMIDPFRYLGQRTFRKNWDRLYRKNLTNGDCVVYLNRGKMKTIYQLLGSPVISCGVSWYMYKLPRRLTVKPNPAIYCWLWWTFTWDNRAL